MKKKLVEFFYAAQTIVVFVALIWLCLVDVILDVPGHGFWIGFGDGFTILFTMIAALLGADIRPWDYTGNGWYVPGFALGFLVFWRTCVEVPIWFPILTDFLPFYGWWKKLSWRWRGYRRD